MSKKLRLNRAIYDEGDIKKAIKAYSEIAEVLFESDETYFICSFVNCRYSDGVTRAEFENYLISLLNKRI